MNARKLPSGSWRARLFLGEDENGKKHYKSFTAATKREAERLALNYAEERAKPDKITFGDALAKYIDSKSNVLSPSTLRGYRQMKKYYDPIKDMDVSEIDQNTVVSFVNDFAGKLRQRPFETHIAYSVRSYACKYRMHHFVLLCPKKKSYNTIFQRTKNCNHCFPIPKQQTMIYTLQFFLHLLEHYEDQKCVDYMQMTYKEIRCMFIKQW